MYAFLKMYTYHTPFYAIKRVQSGNRSPGKVLNAKEGPVWSALENVLFIIKCTIGQLSQWSQAGIHPSIFCFIQGLSRGGSSLSR